MRLAVVAALLASGCDGVFHLVEVELPDALIDAPVDEPETLCFGHAGTLLAPICPEVPPVPLTASVLATSTNCHFTVSQPNGGPELCVLYVPELDLTVPVRAVGPRPLVIIARGRMTIHDGGILDVASRRGATAGAGADTSCNTTGVDGINGTSSSSGGGGGGAGGTFVSSGGGGAMGGTTMFGGTPATSITPSFVQGGCPGGRGGAGSTSTSMVSSGGGAVYLLAGESISIEGAIFAFGAGGVGAGAQYEGGAGGGSGGFIVLDAPSVTLTTTARLLAGGGGGGEGGGTTLVGNPGENGDTGLGGGGMSSGGDGGRGTGTNGFPGLVGSAGLGGGGGGGGGGFTSIYADARLIEMGATVVPPIP